MGLHSAFVANVSVQAGYQQVCFLFGFPAKGTFSHIAWFCHLLLDLKKYSLQIYEILYWFKSPRNSLVFPGFPTFAG
jgi:hypothetical protein